MKTFLYKGRGKRFLEVFRDGKLAAFVDFPGKLLGVRRKMEERVLDGRDLPGDLSVAMEEFGPFLSDVAERLAGRTAELVFVDCEAPGGYDRERPERSRMVSHVFSHYVWQKFGAVLESACGEKGKTLGRALLVRVRSEKNAVFSYDGRSPEKRKPPREKLIYRS